ncbi:YqiA/YcfP family alpha/beta fold hydrolase [Salinimicrobium soli]|uniref:YqiA/YcfP family alpha/beta fold hydrolase n=1 Tax=Salinimicrobium soli TaxID=1254399 RepID=UPI003AAB0F8F
MNILYLHGLDSKLSPEKRLVLEKFGKVYAPDLDYYTDENAIQTILNYYPNLEIDVVMGSSMGGFAGYHVANIIDRPALLFNPAVAKRSVKQHIPDFGEKFNKLKHIVIGQIDDVVEPKDTLNFLLSHFNPVTDLHLHLVPELGHNIPVPFFEEEVTSFFSKL